MIEKLYWILSGKNQINPRFDNQSIIDALSSSTHFAIENCISRFKPLFSNSRKINFIEINPRSIAYHYDNRVKEGLLSTIKLLPIIPNKQNTCIILSQLFPSFWGESYLDKNASLYTIDFNYEISKNLTSDLLSRRNIKISDTDLVIAFNQLAHYMGFKTGFRVLLSEGQLRSHGKNFSWYHHENDFINNCVSALKLGFDAIYIDSAKHINHYDYKNYCGVGALPTYNQMQRISYLIREKANKDVILIGEKCDLNPMFKEMGFNFGTDFGNPNSIYELNHNDYSQIGNYICGPDVSNDNDEFFFSKSERLNRIYNISRTNLPAFLQMNDIWPMRHSSHKEMLESNSYGNGNYHYYGLFENDINYTNHVRNLI